MRPQPPDGASAERTGSWRAGLSLEQLRRSSGAGPEGKGGKRRCRCARCV
ncbi:hypothetical protein NQP46_28145 [Streptomyces albus]|nr:hypothetical protein NQP46_28145 [Streptomyces albus]